MEEFIKTWISKLDPDSQQEFQGDELKIVTERLQKTGLINKQQQDKQHEPLSTDYLLAALYCAYQPNYKISDEIIEEIKKYDKNCLSIVWKYGLHVLKNGIYTTVPKDLQYLFINKQIKKPSITGFYYDLTSRQYQKFIFSVCSVKNRFNNLCDKIKNITKISVDQKIGNMLKMDNISWNNKKDLSELETNIQNFENNLWHVFEAEIPEIMVDTADLFSVFMKFACVSNPPQKLSEAMSKFDIIDYYAIAKIHGTNMLNEIIHSVPNILNLYVSYGITTAIPIKQQFDKDLPKMNIGQERLLWYLHNYFQNSQLRISHKQNTFQRKRADNNSTVFELADDGMVIQSKHQQNYFSILTQQLQEFHDNLKQHLRKLHDHKNGRKKSLLENSREFFNLSCERYECFVEQHARIQIDASDWDITHIDRLIKEIFQTIIDIRQQQIEIQQREVKKQDEIKQAIDAAYSVYDYDYEPGKYLIEKWMTFLRLENLQDQMGKILQLKSCLYPHIFLEQIGEIFGVMFDHSVEGILLQKIQILKIAHTFFQGQQKSEMLIDQFQQWNDTMYRYYKYQYTKKILIDGGLLFQLIQVQNCLWEYVASQNDKLFNDSCHLLSKYLDIPVQNIFPEEYADAASIAKIQRQNQLEENIKNTKSPTLEDKLQRAKIKSIYFKQNEYPKYDEYKKKRENNKGWDDDQKNKYESEFNKYKDIRQQIIELQTKLDEDRNKQNKEFNIQARKIQKEYDDRIKEINNSIDDLNTKKSIITRDFNIKNNFGRQSAKEQYIKDLSEIENEIKQLQNQNYDLLQQYQKKKQEMNAQFNTNMSIIDEGYKKNLEKLVQERQKISKLLEEFDKKGVNISQQLEELPDKKGGALDDSKKMLSNQLISEFVDKFSTYGIMNADVRTEPVTKTQKISRVIEQIKLQKQYLILRKNINQMMVGFDERVAEYKQKQTSVYTGPIFVINQDMYDKFRDVFGDSTDKLCNVIDQKITYQIPQTPISAFTQTLKTIQQFRNVLSNIRQENQNIDEKTRLSLVRAFKQYAQLEWTNQFINLINNLYDIPIIHLTQFQHLEFQEIVFTLFASSVKSEAFGMDIDPISEQNIQSILNDEQYKKYKNIIWAFDIIRNIKFVRREKNILIWIICKIFKDIILINDIFNIFESAKTNEQYIRQFINFFIGQLTPMEKITWGIVFPKIHKVLAKQTEFIQLAKQWFGDSAQYLNDDSKLSTCEGYYSHLLIMYNKQENTDKFFFIRD